jgi:RHS repeat-associated protein
MTYAGPNQLERATFGSTTQTTGANGVNVDKTSTSSTYYRRDNDGTLHSERLPSGAIHYYLLDGLGSTAALADSAGSKSQSYAYDPYGATTVSNSTGAANPWRYAGTYQDSTGFYKMGVRYYSPALMRWTQQDPVQAPSDVQQLNRYQYGGDNPVNATDPGGRDICAHLSGALLGLACLERAIYKDKSPRRVAITTLHSTYIALDVAAGAAACAETGPAGCAAAAASGTAAEAYLARTAFQGSYLNP